MSKRVFIVHGWGGSPKKDWMPWMARELKACGFEVHVPRLPLSATPRIHKWVPALAAAVGTADSDTYFVGHSMGCQTIARYLSTLPKETRIGGAVFVAGFFKRLTGIEEDVKGEGLANAAKNIPALIQAAQKIVTEWLDTPLDLEVVRSHLPKSIAIFSDNDLYVPLDNQDAYREKLQSEILIEHGMHHFDGDSGITELPVARDALLKIAK